MKRGMSLCLSSIVAGLFSCSVLAQDFDYHPGLSDNFTLVLGAVKSHNPFTISAEGIIEDEIEKTIDFYDSILMVDGYQKGLVDGIVVD